MKKGEMKQEQKQIKGKMRLMKEKMKQRKKRRMRTTRTRKMRKMRRTERKKTRMRILISSFTQSRNLQRNQARIRTSTSQRA